MVITIKEYRKILDDKKSSNEQIAKRLQYLEALCRNITKSELKTYVTKTRNNTKS